MIIDTAPGRFKISICVRERDNLQCADVGNHHNIVYLLKLAQYQSDASLTFAPCFCRLRHCTSQWALCQVCRILGSHYLQPGIANFIAIIYYDILSLILIGPSLWFGLSGGTQRIQIAHSPYQKCILQSANETTSKSLIK